MAICPAMNSELDSDSAAAASAVVATVSKVNQQAFAVHAAAHLGLGFELVADIEEQKNWSQYSVTWYGKAMSNFHRFPNQLKQRWRHDAAVMVASG